MNNKYHKFVIVVLLKISDFYGSKLKPENLSVKNISKTISFQKDKIICLFYVVLKIFNP